MTKQQSSKPRAEKVATTSAKITDEQLECLRACFPEVFTEGKVDMDKFKDTLGDLTENGERYSFTWAGKKDAIRLLQVPSTATLVPDKKESVDFDHAQNLFIEGDNLEVLKLLYKSYFGRVKMIYIDPPYNTGNDFIYPDNFTDPLSTYMQMTGQKDEEGNVLTSNTETNGRYHSAWLSMMYPRLFLARQFLKDDGLIFVSIDDTEVHNLRMVMNEIFGEDNFLAQIVWQKIHSTKNDAKYFSDNHEYILCYAKSVEHCSIKLLPRTEEMDARYKNPDDDPRGAWTSGDLVANQERKDGYYDVKSPQTGKVFNVPKGKHWVYSKSNLAKLIEEGRIYFGKDGNAFPRLKRYLNEVQQGKKADTLWGCKDVGHYQEAKREIKKMFDGKEYFETPKPVSMLLQVLMLATESDDIVLDFFAGSASTAHAVAALNLNDGGNRKCITVQLPEPCGLASEAYKDGYGTIADIAKERIRRALKQLKSNEGFKVFKLHESNYRGWEGTDERTLEAWGQQMAAFVDPLKDGWDEESVIYEVAIKEGYSLNMQIERMDALKGATVYKVTDPEKEQSFYITLDKELDLAALKPLNLSKEDLFVCRDIALNDETSANLALQCRLKTI